MKKQVGKSAYGFERYLHPDRWASYYMQITLIRKIGPRSMLEVGVGDGFLRNYIRTGTPLSHQCLDIAEDLKPDILGSVEEIPIPDGSFDLVTAFQVLEHLPYEKFEQTLSEIARVSKRYALISLPHFGPAVKFDLKLPLLPEIRLAFKVPVPLKHKFNGQHYWEIGKRGYSRKRVRRKIKEHFKIIDEFIPFHNQYHRFYVLEKK